MFSLLSSELFNVKTSTDSCQEGVNNQCNTLDVESGSGGGSSLDKIPSFPLINTHDSESARFYGEDAGKEEHWRRELSARRFYVKCRDGIAVAQAKGYTVRWFTLTESDYAIGMGLDFRKCVHAFEEKIRRDYGRDTGFCWVEHLQGAKIRKNRHFIEWGTEKLDVENINDYWMKVYGSYVSLPRDKRSGKAQMVVGKAEKCASYLSGYVAGDGFVRARFSNNWIFVGWFEYSKWHKRSYGVYPELPWLVGMSLKSSAERCHDSRYVEWLGSIHDKVERKLTERAFGKSLDEIRWHQEYLARRKRR